MVMQTLYKGPTPDGDCALLLAVPLFAATDFDSNLTALTSRQHMSNARDTTRVSN